jgi:hypothetical protein
MGMLAMVHTLNFQTCRKTRHSVQIVQQQLETQNVMEYFNSPASYLLHCAPTNIHKLLPPWILPSPQPRLSLCVPQSAVEAMASP